MALAVEHHRARLSCIPTRLTQINYRHPSSLSLCVPTEVLLALDSDWTLLNTISHSMDVLSCRRLSDGRFACSFSFYYTYFWLFLCLFFRSVVVLFLVLISITE